jgi:hypothetical protein
MSETYFRVENWYQDIKNHTFQTCCVDLGYAEAKSLMRACELFRQQREYIGRVMSFTFSPLHSNKLDRMVRRSSPI